MSQTRLDPAEVAPEALDHLSEVLAAPGRAALVDEKGNRVELPIPIFRHLVRVVELMAQRRAIVLLPEDETFTTQAAANYLGVSRQHLVDLLEDGKIPYHKVGSHRRVYFRDLNSYEKQREQKRRSTVDRLMGKVEGSGLYDSPDPNDTR
jgi:excisionase family DNA binding protein